MLPSSSCAGARASTLSILIVLLTFQLVYGIQSAKSRISAATPGTTGASSGGLLAVTEGGGGGASASVAKAELEDSAAEGPDLLAASGSGVQDKLPRQPTEQHKLERIGCLWGPKAKWHLTPIAEAKWDNASIEESVNPDSVSLFGCAVPKIPMSWVRRIQALDHEKIHDYNFQGTWMWEYYRETLPPPIWRAWHSNILGADSTSRDEPQAKARDWVVAFARENFTDHDFFKVTDADEFYQKLGSFDVSEPGKYHDIRHNNGSDYLSLVNDFDAPYWQTMASSKFTLCPGGDSPWSMRLYEAIVSGSIPVIASSRTDVGLPHLWALWDIPYRYYNLETGDELVYREDWVEENLRLFIQYQTFHEGDNEPPHTFNVTRRLLEGKHLLPVQDGEGAFFGSGARVPAPLVDAAFSPKPKAPATRVEASEVLLTGLEGGSSPQGQGPSPAADASPKG